LQTGSQFSNSACVFCCKENIHVNEKKSQYSVEILMKMGYTTVEREDINDVDSI